MYFPDISPYSYLKGASEPGTLNVGWLHPEHPFPTGSPSEQTLVKILVLCRYCVNQTRGTHHCYFCTDHPRVVQVQSDQGIICLGSAEIRVMSRAGKVYAAPTLIYHYMKNHNYRPPNEFLEALDEMDLQKLERFE